MVIGRATRRCVLNRGLSALTPARTTRKARVASIATSKSIFHRAKPCSMPCVHSQKHSASNKRCSAFHQHVSQWPRAEELAPWAQRQATATCKSGHSLALCALGSCLMQVFPAMRKAAEALQSTFLDCRAETRQGVFHADWGTLKTRSSIMKAAPDGDLEPGGRSLPVQSSTAASPAQPLPETTCG